MTAFFKIRKDNKGFSLIEMLISMIIFSIVMGIIYSFLLQTKKELTEAEIELTLTSDAQSAINSLRKDLYQIGVGRDVVKKQPMILRAGMYDLIFCADLDREIRNPEKRYGSTDPNLFPPSGISAAFRPLYTILDTSIPETYRFTGWDNDVEYGYKNLGAEIVRYSLDSNQDNKINHLDLEDNITVGEARLRTTNPNDFWLFKEWWGCIKDGGGYRNAHSGVHPVALNVRGLFYDPENGVTAEQNKNLKYPNGDYPSVMFTYWGHFWDSLTTPNEPSHPDWPGEPLDLWGDWGNMDPIPLVQSVMPGPFGARNGVLDPNEIEKMLENPMWSEVNLNYMRYITGRAGETPDGDQNGNGIPGENRLDQFIRRIGVNIVVESSSPYQKAPNLRRSDLHNPNKPVYYYYKDYEVNIDINPKNLAYSGSALVDIEQMTPTPVPTNPPTETPTNTPGPGTPTATPDTPTAEPSPTPTPTTEPGSPFDPSDGEIFLGGRSLIYARSLPHDFNDFEEICQYIGSTRYFVSNGYDITYAKPANLTTPPFNQDPWNDLVFANNKSWGEGDNLFCLKHYANKGIEGLFGLQKAMAGKAPLDRITSIAAGNLGDFGYIPPVYDKIVVATHRYDADILGKNNLQIFGIEGAFGSLVLLETPGTLTIEGPKDRFIKDMAIADFMGKGTEQLAVMNNTNDGTPQITIYDLSGGNWTNFVTLPPVNFTQGVQCAKLVVAPVLDNVNIYSEPDLIVVAENGEFAVFRNKRNASLDFEGPLYPPDQSVVFKDFDNVTGAVVYDSTNLSGTSYLPVLAIAGNSSEDMNLVHYTMPSIDDIQRPDYASGPLWDGARPSNFVIKGMVYVPIRKPVNTVTTFLAFNAKIGQDDFLIISKNPFGYPGVSVSFCYSQLIGTVGGVNCITSIRNELSQAMQTPTPNPTFSPTPLPTAIYTISPP
ncbi:MAG: prepilin-type N-terminal cleavage/methylation domain-containing protein [bacterium]